MPKKYQLLSMEDKFIKVSAIRPNNRNPRFISDSSFSTLCKLIEKYPKFLEKRPIVIESWENPVILAGNMRFRALKKLKHKKIPSAWVTTAETLSPEEKEAFMLIDNNQLGQWDFEMLANEFDIELLDELNIFIPNLNMPGDDIDENSIDQHTAARPEKHGDTLTVKLTFEPEDFTYFNENIYRYGKTMEQAILKLLKKPYNELTESQAAN